MLNEQPAFEQPAAPVYNPPVNSMQFNPAQPANLGQPGYPVQPPVNPDAKKKKTALIAGIAGGVALLLVVIGVVLFFVLGDKDKGDDEDDGSKKPKTTQSANNDGDDIVVNGDNNKGGEDATAPTKPAVKTLEGKWTMSMLDETDLDFNYYYELKKDGTLNTFAVESEVRKAIMNYYDSMLRGEAEMYDEDIDELAQEEGYSSYQEMLDELVDEEMEYMDLDDINMTGTWEKLSDTKLSMTIDGDEEIFEFVLSGDKLTLTDEYGDSMEFKRA